MPDSSSPHGGVEGGEADRLRWPETGGVKILLQMTLLSHLVVVAVPVLRAQIALLYPAIVPEPFTTGLYAVLGLGVGVILVWLLRSESLVSTHRFDGQDAREEYLARESPARRRVLASGGLVIVGGSLALVTYERFVSTLLYVVDALVIVIGQFEWTITVVDGFYVAGFVAGFELFAIGVDRFLVGGLRRYIRYRHGRR